MQIRKEIMLIGPEFNPSGYLSNTHIYEKHRELLQKLVTYTRMHDSELAERMSKNERAYAIWGNEKQLDDPTCKRMLRFIGWSEKLNYYDTPEPFIDYLCYGRNTKYILILENKDIWFSLRKIFMENNSSYTLYNEPFDGLLYGEGKKVTRDGALEEYSNEGFAERPVFTYWGDLDYEGISIFLKLSANRLVRLFTPGYIAMLEHTKSKKELPLCKTFQSRPNQLNDFLCHFAPEAATEIRSILESGKYIPQEICNYPRLKASCLKHEIYNRVNEGLGQACLPMTE
jgi:hypothetical protein